MISAVIIVLPVEVDVWAPKEFANGEYEVGKASNCTSLVPVSDSLSNTCTVLSMRSGGW